jgi:Exoribonuclease R
MVAEAMILCGTVAATKAIEKDLALPFRSQLPAELPSPAQLESLGDGAVRFAAIKRCLSRGLMGTAPAAHFSLGVPAYTQATSPIRRYGDLLVQRQFAALLSLDGHDEPLDTESLQTLLQQLETAVREGIAVTREDQRHWQQVWFEQHSGECWPVDFLRWLRPQDRLGLVRIEDLALDLAATCPPGSQPGDSLVLGVVGVDSVRDQLHLVADVPGSG